MAHAGVASRRACEEMIRQGRVTVNGVTVTQMGLRVDPARDRICVDGELLSFPSTHTYILLHKPAGVVCTASDTHGRPTVLDMVSSAERLYPVGRLDMDSEGLLLLTDDGELAYRLTHPRYEVEKEYHLLVRGVPDNRALWRWRKGRVLSGERPAPAWVEVLHRGEQGTWLRVVLHEGRKRQVRRTAEALGYPVIRLIRMRQDGVHLGDLPVGHWRELTAQELASLRQVAARERPRRRGTDQRSV